MDIEIDKECFNKNLEIIENIYHTAVVLADFCDSHQEIEEMMNIFPVVKYLKKESDKVLYNFTNIKLDIDERIY